MTDHERQLVHHALSAASHELRAAQRCVESLANFFESIRHEFYPHQASRIWHILNRIPNLNRIPLYPPPKGEEPLMQASQRFRWYFDEGALPYYQAMHGQSMINELSELLSGVALESIAESKGHESWLAYQNQADGAR